MSLIWEEPPKAQRGPHAFERSELRQEVDKVIEELLGQPHRWARLYDFNDRADAEKRAGFIRGATGPGWNVAVRQTDWGWSVFARFTGEPRKRRPKKEAEPEFQS